jgi:GNAT superfamily N-acetyltransferase
MDRRISVRELQRVEAGRLAEIIRRTWGSDRMVAHGRLYEPARMPGFVAELEGEWVGHLTYEIVDGACEITLLEALREGVGVGSALIDRTVALCRDRGVRRLWLVTTNDNVDALRWYQRRGFVLAAIRRDAVTEARRTLKPEIPLIGRDGIPIRDELDLELPMEPGRP